MKVFQQEYDDGIGTAVANDKSVSFASAVEPLNVESVSTQMKALASVQDADMYYVQSILVTSNWNKNDDVFQPDEIWKAKETPEHKPTNLNHDEHTIVGHIISNYPITNEGMLIDKETPVDNLPENFHILTGSVIYKAYTDPELKERTRDLIASIEDGTKYVSMECYFNNFDYGLISKVDGSYKVVPRDHASAYLTKYLRAYGGTGEKDEYKIGRVLRNITFSGKGYVDKPANVNSVILKDKIEKFDDLKKEDLKNEDLENKGVSLEYVETHNTVEACIMSKQELETETKEELVVASETEAETAVEAVATENATEEAVEVTETEQVVEASQEEVETQQESEAEMKKEDEVKAEMMKKKLDEAEAEMMKLKNEMKKDKESLAEMTKKYATIMKDQQMKKRMASLAECGFEDNEIEESLAAYDALDDDAFDAVIAVYKKKMAKQTPKHKEEKDDEAEAGKMPPALKEALEKKKKKEEESKAEDFDTAEEILEEVEETEALDLTVGGEDNSEMNTTSAALIEFVYSRLGKKLNKGE